MWGQAEVSCFQSVQIQAVETLRKKMYGGHTGHSTQNLPFIREAAILKNYEPWVRILCMLTGRESIFSTSVGFSLGLPPGSRCNIAEIPRPLLEGCKLRSPSFSIKTPTMSFLWGLNTFPVQNLVAMWISWFWHLRFPTRPVSGIYPFVV